MNLIEFVVLLVVAGVCGGIGQALAGVSRGGLIMAVVLGFIGALVGRWLADSLGLPEILTVQLDGRPFPVIWSIIGSALFVALISALTRKDGRGKKG